MCTCAANMVVNAASLLIRVLLKSYSFDDICIYDICITLSRLYSNQGHLSELILYWHLVFLPKCIVVWECQRVQESPVQQHQLVIDLSDLQWPERRRAETHMFVDRQEDEDMSMHTVYVCLLTFRLPGLSFEWLHPNEWLHCGSWPLHFLAVLKQGKDLMFSSNDFQCWGSHEEYTQARNVHSEHGY